MLKQPRKKTSRSVLPPLSASVLQQLKLDAADIVATAKRKNFTLDRWEESEERFHAKHYFNLGCWLFYWCRLIYKTGDIGFQNRVDCLARIMEADLCPLGYAFFVVFEFGERQFDTLLEMGDADLVIEAVRQKYLVTKNAGIKNGFTYFEWPLDRNRSKSNVQLELL